MKRVILITLGLLILTALISQEPAALGPTLAYLDEVVLGSDWSDGSMPTRAHRWPGGPIFWALYGPDAARWRARVEQTLDELEPMTGGVVDFIEVPYGPKTTARLVIYAGPVASWPGAAWLHDRGVLGYTALYLERTGAITAAHVLLATPGLGFGALVAREELFQALGFLGDAATVASVTKTDDLRGLYSDLDRFWLRLVYSGTYTNADRERLAHDATALIWAGRGPGAK